jgi:hypothetical protein
MVSRQTLAATAPARILDDLTTPAGHHIIRTSVEALTQSQDPGDRRKGHKASASDDTGNVRERDESREREKVNVGGRESGSGRGQKVREKGKGQGGRSTAGVGKNGKRGEKRADATEHARWVFRTLVSADGAIVGVVNETTGEV